MVQLPSAPSESGNSRPTFAAVSCAVARMTPDSQVMVFDAASTSRILFSRVSDRITSP